MSKDPSFYDRFNTWMKTSIGLRIFTIVFLVLILLIPVNMIESLIWERQQYREDVLREISGTWGNEQTVTGLVLTVPFNRYYVTQDANGVDKTTEQKYNMHFLPSSLKIDGDVSPEKRKRGIYEVVVYTSDLKISGRFDRPDFSKLGIKEEHVLWNEAKISMGLSDLRSIQDSVVLDWAGEQLLFEPGLPDTDVMSAGITTPVELDSLESAFSFSLGLRFNGSNGLHFIPLGKTTSVHLNSTWKDPKFNGAFLPDEREVSEEGFTADWEVFHLNRIFPQVFEGSTHGIGESAFGLDLLMPVGIYQKSTRSIKYAILFISLTFMVYFFSQIQNNVRMHPVQYLIVGLAICLFFTILLALSEHIGFDYAYMIGSAAIIGMITAYSQSIFKNMRLTMILAGVMIMIYGFIYIIIQMQDYSLLMGTIGLFIILAIVMYISRNIDWYGKGDELKDLNA